MLRKEISYEDYNGNPRTETHYFNLSEAELTEMELSENGGLTKVLEKIISEQDTQKISATFKKLILDSYGEKSNDGKRFIKSVELSTAFSQTEAYVKLYMSLIKDENAATAFVTGIIPPGLRSAKANDTPAGTL